MPIASMTGFARRRGAHGETRWVWELKSVNGRGLEVRLRAAPGFEGIESAAREVLARHLSRGTVHALLAVERPPRVVEARIDTTLLAALVKAAEAARAGTDLSPATLDGLLRVPGVIAVIEAGEDEAARAALHEALLTDLAGAAAELAAARAAEGASLAAILEARLAEIETLTRAAEDHPARRPETIKARLAENIRALLETRDGLDPDRLHQEAVLIAARADIREEIDRLLAHVERARALMAEGGAVGRKLDFLAQEFNREANTLCAKAADRELTGIGLSLKTAIDQLREQIQNVE